MENWQKCRFCILLSKSVEIWNKFVFTDQKEITIDNEYCWSTDHLGRPIDIYSDPDYRMQCIGFWKENLKSYLITYDELDAFTKYRLVWWQLWDFILLHINFNRSYKELFAMSNSIEKKFNNFDVCVSNKLNHVNFSSFFDCL